jgi:hypothetical protein
MLKINFRSTEREAIASPEETINISKLTKKEFIHVKYHSFIRSLMCCFYL